MGNNPVKFSYKQIWFIAYPILISLVMEQLIGMTDTAFMGRVGEVELGASAIAGVYYMTFYMIAFGFSLGAQIIMGRRNGEGNYAKIGPIFYKGTYFLLGVALVLFVSSHFVSPLILERFIDSPHVHEAAVSYIRWRVYGFFFSFVAVMFRAFFVGTTQTKTLTLNSIVMVLSNVVFNYILVFGKLGFPAMGIAGAAWSTFISQVCSFTILLFMDRKGENIRIHYRHFTPTPAYLKEIVYGGSPSLCRQGLASVSTILLNVAAGNFGDAAIAGMSIVTRICMFINSFVIGFGQGFQPVCGFNYGAGLNRRVRKGFWYCVKVGVIFLAICSLIGYIYAPEVVSWFRKEDPQVIAVGAEALRWQLITLPLGAWVILCNMLLQTIRQPRRAVILSSSRQGLFFIPLILILPYFLQLQGVEMCQAAADLCSFLLALPLTIPVLKSLRIDRTPMKEENA